jgi:hypothetical protein
MRVSILAAALLVAACQSSTPEPSPSEDESAPASVEPSAEPSASATPIGSGVTTFGSGPGPAMARDVAAFEGGFVAVGVQYADSLPNLGPPPEHEGRIWLSPDGAVWEDVTPSGELTNVDLSEVFVRADGTLVVMGGVSLFEPGGWELSSLGAWESSDGQSWQAITSPVPGVVGNVETGAVGYIALAYPGMDDSDPAVWFSSDGTTWTVTHELSDGTYDLDAGDQGFVVVGDTQTVAAGEDLQWVPASNPPPGVGPNLAALGGDWVAVPNAGLGPTATSWFAADGLNWAQSGTLQMAEVQADQQTTCREYPNGAVSTAGSTFLSTSLSGPCSEGGFIVHGTVYWSSDGAAWTALAFPAGQVGTSHSGSRVDGAAEANDVLVLAGQLDRQAALWTNPLD